VVVPLQVCHARFRLHRDLYFPGNHKIPQPVVLHRVPFSQLYTCSSTEITFFPCSFANQLSSGPPTLTLPAYLLPPGTLPVDLWRQQALFSALEGRELPCTRNLWGESPDLYTTTHGMPN